MSKCIDVLITLIKESRGWGRVQVQGPVFLGPACGQPGTFLSTGPMIILLETLKFHTCEAGRCSSLTPGTVCSARLARQSLSFEPLFGIASTE